MFDIEPSDNNSSPEFHNFTRCGDCAWAALYFDGSAHVVGLSCYYISHNPALLDLRQPEDFCNKV
jgi:hypothetical protein